VSTPVTKYEMMRQAAEDDLLTFIRLVAPHRVLGTIHEDVIRWWCRDEAKSHQLLLLPRDHQKSVLVAFRVAWEITKNPAVTVLYLSSTAGLAEKQLRFIKSILDSKIYKRYWPEMINPKEGLREKWATDSIIVDHPIRKREAPGDPTIFTGGLTTSLTGFHCDIAVLDDVVVQENAYVRDGREKVKSQYSLLASIETTGAREFVVGTRYHPKDLYGEMLDMEAQEFDEFGNVKSETAVYELMQHEVEDSGDGAGEYLWPRQQRKDGKWFGFNQTILAKKRAQYLDKSQFRAQYYNNPNDPDNEAIPRDTFQYYERAKLEKRGVNWYYMGKELRIFAAIDFAFSVKKRADYTALVIVGVDSDGLYYVLGIERFKSNRISDYYKKIFDAHTHWGFRKIRAEVNVAQDAIVEELALRVRESGLSLSIDRFRPTRAHGKKEERIEAILKPRYENMAVLHYRGGLCQELEDELVQERPAHDDIKDALASAIDVAVIPRNKRKNSNVTELRPAGRFGGVAFR
jgi:hypothetical protein